MKSSIGNWYKTWFNSQDYLDLYKHRNSKDAAKIVSLISRTIKLQPNLKVLDLACGNGRHSILFAKKGCNVLGIDLSEYLISQAKKKLKSDYLSHFNKLKFEIRDMRNINHIGGFDLVVNLFSSFGYFSRDKDNTKVVKSVYDALKPGGYFFFDFLNKNYTIKKLVPFDIKQLQSGVVLQIRQIKKGFVQKDIIIFKNIGGSRETFSHFTEKVRMYSLIELRKMFSEHNLKITKIFGDYFGKSFNKNNRHKHSS